jgi:hypothetical protein
MGAGKKLMQKERSAARTPTIDYFLVRHLQTNQIIGRIANLSVGGLMLIANKPLTVRRVYELQLIFPRTLYDKTSISFTAEARWSKFNSFADWWELGFEIREINQESKSLLEQIIQLLTSDNLTQAVDNRPIQNKAISKVHYLKTR